MIEKADVSLNGYFDQILEGVVGKAQDFIPCVKLLIANRMEHCYSISRFKDLPDEYFRWLGFTKPKSDRTLNRTLERVGRSFQFIVNRHQDIIKEHDLVTKEQFPDFSSTYFEGKKTPMGRLGYSRDGEPGKLQITFGICTRMNDIPTALTIQKGNVRKRNISVSCSRLQNMYLMRTAFSSLIAEEIPNRIKNWSAQTTSNTSH